jgi:hypothetical protein
MKCTACGKEHTKKEIIYTEDKLPYCGNPFTCNDAHPNSIKNILANQGAVKMFTEEELAVNNFETLNVTAEMKERIMKIATKPQSIRLSKLEIAHYLIMLQDTKKLSSISEAVRYCVSLAMRAEPVQEQEPKQSDVLKLGNTMVEIPIEKNVEPADEEQFTF